MPGYWFNVEVTSPDRCDYGGLVPGLGDTHDDAARDCASRLIDVYPDARVMILGAFSRLDPDEANQVRIADRFGIPVIGIYGRVSRGELSRFEDESAPIRQMTREEEAVWIHLTTSYYESEVDDWLAQLRAIRSS
jgi:hypothetical protein